MNIKTGLLVLGLMAVVSACIDSGGDDEGDAGGGGGGGSATVERISFNGLVADGYLANATVCLDINENKKCDADEPSTTSVAGGAFEINDATQEQRDSFPLLVEVVVGTTVDEDTISEAAPAGVAFSKPLTLTAPVGYEFISPLTTMVQSEVEKGSSEAEAEAVVQEKLGTTLDLGADYIAGKASGANAAEFEQLHQVAQVTARVISENYDNLQTVADNNADVSIDDLISAIVSEVFEALDEITEQVAAVAADPDTEFNADTLAQVIDDEVVDLEPDTIEEVIEQDKATEAATGVDMSELLKSPGLFVFETEKNDDGTVDIGYAAVYNDADGNFQADAFGWSGFTFNPVTDTDMDSDEGGPVYILGGSGWVLTPGFWTIDSITGFADGRIELSRANGSVIDRLISREVDLSGLNTRVVMGEVDDVDGLWGNYLSATATFPAAAKGYTVAENGSDDVYVFEDWDGCDTPVGGLCSFAYVQNNATLTDGQAQSFAAITSATAYALSGVDDADLNGIKGVELDYSSTHKLWAEIVAGGAVNYYKVGHDHSNPSVSFLGASTWSSVALNAAAAIELVTIPELMEFDDAAENGRIVLGLIDGYIRQAWYRNSADSNVPQLRLLNATATAAVTGSNFSLDNLPLALRPLCEDGNTDWDGLFENIATQWGTVADYENAVQSCWDGVYPMAVSDDVFSDAILKNLTTGSITATLANHSGVTITKNGEKLWFTWEVVDESFRMSMQRNRGDDTFVTITFSSENVIIDPLQNYFQSKWMSQNSDVSSVYDDRVFIYSEAFEFKGSVNAASDPTPAEAFVAATLPGTYSWTTGEGAATFTFTANNEGTIHWPAEAGDSENPDGYDDTTTWSIDSDGRLLIAMHSATGEFEGVERFTISSGTLASGTVMAEGINQLGEFSSFASFPWEKTGDL